MEQKFLDKEGVKVLWRQASLKDYPNNETLMAVIDAIDETKADKDDIPIKPFPFYDKEIITTNGKDITKYIVDIEELEDGVIYSFQDKDYTTEYFSCWLSVICDDGTKKELIGTTTKNDLWSFYKHPNGKVIDFYDIKSFNAYHTVNITDKTTADKVVYNTDLVSEYLPVYNYFEYTPTDNYHPATKKYVDDSVNNIEIPEGFSGSWNDLTDRPFYESVVISKQMIIEPTEHTFIKQLEGSDESGYNWEVTENLIINDTEHVSWTEGEQITVLWNDVEYTSEVTMGKGNYMLFPGCGTIYLPSVDYLNFNIRPTFDEYYDVLPDGMNVGDQVEFPVTFSIYRATNENQIKQLDEKFIPSTIARTSDIVNSNWNENDENSKAHILNRTHYIDIVQAEIATVKNVSNSTKVQFKCKNEFCFANTSAIKVTIKGSDDSILYEKELTRQKLDYSQPGIGIVVSTGWFGNVNLCDDSPGLDDSNFPTDSDAPICIFGEESGSGGSIINDNIVFTHLSLRIDESLLSTTSDSYNVEIIDMDNMEDIYYPLDEKYIPETIARIADISEQVQSNYEENDSSSLAHIQNRPFYKKPNENQILADGNFTIELTTNWVEDNLTYYGAQLPFSVIEDDGLISKCEITINDVTYTASSSYSTDTNTYCFDYWASNGTQFSVLYDESRNSYIIEFYGGFDFNIGDSIYVKIKDLREYIYKHLSEEFLPLTLKKSWTLGKNNDNSASGSLVAGYNNKNTNSNNITIGHSNDNAGQYSALIGVYNKTTASNTYLLGNQLIASKGGQTVLGKYNIEDNNGDSRQGSKLFIVGNGSSNGRSNAHTLDVNGNAWFSGDIYVGSTSGTNKDTGSKKLATEDYVATELSDYYLKTEVDTLHTEIEDYVDNQVAALVNSAPETLDTLGELAAAFEENKEVVEALDASITNKQDKVSDTLILVDTVTGIQHKIQIQNGQLVSFPVE